MDAKSTETIPGVWWKFWDAQCLWVFFWIVERSIRFLLFFSISKRFPILVIYTKCRWFSTVLYFITITIPFFRVGRRSQDPTLSFPVSAAPPLLQNNNRPDYSTRSKVSFDGKTFEVALNVEDFKPEVWLNDLCSYLVTNFLLTFPISFVYPYFLTKLCLIDKVCGHSHNSISNLVIPPHTPSLKSTMLSRRSMWRPRVGHCQSVLYTQGRGGASSLRRSSLFPPGYCLTDWTLPSPAVASSPSLLPATVQPRPPSSTSSRPSRRWSSPVWSVMMRNLTLSWMWRITGNSHIICSRSVLVVIVTLVPE